LGAVDLRGLEVVELAEEEGHHFLKETGRLVLGGDGGEKRERGGGLLIRSPRMSRAAVM